MYVRTCQACGNTQTAKPPATYKGKTESWRDTKCTRCKSEALDYGSDGWVRDETGKLTQPVFDYTADETP